MLTKEEFYKIGIKKYKCVKHIIDVVGFKDFDTLETDLIDVLEKTGAAIVDAPTKDEIIIKFEDNIVIVVKKDGTVSTKAGYDLGDWEQILWEWLPID